MLNCPSISSWLRQFNAAERPLAELILSKLRFVTNDEIAHDLSEALMEKVDITTRRQSQIIIESIIPFEDIKRYWRDQIGKDQEPEREPELYQDYYPSEVRDYDSGSEKLLDVIIRSEYRRVQDRYAAARKPHPIVRTRHEINALKESSQKVDFILITDNIGSGKQVIDALDRLAAFCTTGPFSNCDVRISVIAWTATKAGTEAITTWASTMPPTYGNIYKLVAQSLIDHLNIFSLNLTQTYHDLGDLESREQLFDLFRKYGDPKNKKKHTRGLGFRKIASRTVLLGSSCPNTVPDFLYSSSGSEGYVPLFPGKRIPPDINEVMVHDTRYNPQHTEAKERHEQRIRKQHLLVAANRPVKRGDAKWGILVLAVAGTAREEAILSSNISYHRFRQAERQLIALGWLTADFTATKEGENSVRTYGRKSNQADYASARRYMKRKVDARNVTYYPQSLRGVR
ncbi:hypothetical protein [Pseudarthrobacter sp. NamE5]|uniref:phosphoribosyltransferase-like protein n=1 Tax=Pseudarthrobacter sp. NamE5 TaxID=2576839 RepID=UPI00110BA1E7|nr:hypothetical protein [Pseudarthrobacter sp. NamE5]TLM86003.1 hypothetical protein FDW84_06920 [Pseudarthrobacter sp. NamE5]